MLQRFEWHSVVIVSLIKRPSAGSRFFLPQSDFFLEFDEVLELKLHAVNPNMQKSIQCSVLNNGIAGMEMRFASFESRDFLNKTEGIFHPKFMKVL